MRALELKSILRTVVSGASVLLICAGIAQAQEADITAKATSALLPDGNAVPMWGYSCDNAGSLGVSCSALNPQANGAPRRPGFALRTRPSALSTPLRRLFGKSAQHCDGAGDDRHQLLVVDARAVA